MYSTPYSYHILMKFEVCGQIFEKPSNNEFHENPSKMGNEKVGRIENYRVFNLKVDR
jgi:hypothetical protein